MLEFDLKEALNQIPELRGQGGPRGVIKGVVTDSRHAGEGDLFVALKGENSDGHRYVGEALSRGAFGCVVEKGKAPAGLRCKCFEVEDPLATLGRIGGFVRSRFGGRVIAVTGSMGKTTCKEILAALLQGKYATAKAPASFNNAIGVPLTVLGLEKSTEVLVSEVGANHPGEIRSLCEILRPNDGLVLNVAPVHLEGFGSLEGVAKAKAELAASLSAAGTLYLNASIAYLEHFKREAACKPRFFGNGTDLSPEIVSSGRDGVCFRLGHYGEFFLPGACLQHVQSAAGAICVALDYGLEVPLIRDRLLEFRLPPLRWQQEEAGGARLILDCYNSNPESVRSAVCGASALSRNGVTVVLGDMLELGKDSSRFHREVGEYLEGSSAEKVYLYGREVGATYEVLSGNSFGGEVGLFQDSRILAQEVARNVRSGDVVLFKASRAVGLEQVANKVRELLGSQGA